nr:hypothetical protein [Heyndrickxia coagulans]
MTNNRYEPELKQKNAYYNYLKNKKHAYRQEKAEIQRKIVEIYHREEG